MEGDRERENVRGDREGKRVRQNSERSIILLDIIESFTPSVVILTVFPHRVLLASTAC